ncbi:MAG: hypothetical protein ACXV2D_07180, partial [Halobacteriota archaeon]
LREYHFERVAPGLATFFKPFANYEPCYEARDRCVPRRKETLVSVDTLGDLSVSGNHDGVLHVRSACTNRSERFFSAFIGHTLQAKTESFRRGEMALFGSCPGTSHLRTPTLTIKKCPRCGEDVEIFSSDVKVKCGKCGLTVFNDMNLCIHWCAYAKECVGPELYEQLTKADKEQNKSL